MQIYIKYDHISSTAQVISSVTQKIMHYPKFLDTHNQNTLLITTCI